MWIINTFKKPWVLLMFFLILAYIWGVVSFQHYIPAGTGFLISLYSTMILSVGLFIFFLKTHINSISKATYLWFAVAFLFILQPILNKINYIDDLFLSFLTILLCALCSWAISLFNEHQKKYAVIAMAWGILGSGVFTAMSQLAQLFHWESLYQILFLKVNTNRLPGNIGQANQAAFVLVLAISAIIYLCYEYKNTAFFKKYQWILIILANGIVALLSFGIALTISRGGLVLLACTLLGSAILYYDTIKIRLLALFGFVPVSILGYILGSNMIQAFNQDPMTAMGRIVGENQTSGLREALLQQAWLAFQSSPITGIGWDGLKYFGLQYAEQLSWFTVANHSHNIVAQIAVEFGVLGLIVFIGFAWLVLKNVRLNLPFYKAYSLIVLGLIFAYSLNEYPLWYFKFLLLTVFFIAILDESKKVISFDFKKLLSAISILFVLGGGYYIYQYYHYVAVSYAIQAEETDYEQDIEAYKTLPYVFGYTKYKELMFYMLNPISRENLEVQITLGNRVLSTYLDSFLMLKQANLLMLAGKEQEADHLLRANCIFTTHINVGQYCPSTVAFLEDLIKQDPSYQGYLDRLALWHEQYYKKPLPPAQRDE